MVQKNNMKNYFLGCISLLIVLTACGPKQVQVSMTSGTPYSDSSFDFSMLAYIKSDTISFGSSRIFDRTFAYQGSKGDSLNLEVWYPASKRADSSQLLLFIPGFRDQPLELYPLAIAGTQRGFIAAILCPRGADINKNVPFDYGIFQLQDAQDALRAYQKDGNLQQLKVAVFGCSLGSAVALELTVSDDRVRTAALESIMPDLTVTSKKLLNGEEQDSLTTLASKNNININDFNPGTVIQHPFSKPLFIVWGANDKLVTEEERNALRTTIEKKSLPATFEVVPDVGHLLRYGFPLSQQETMKLNDKIISFLVSGI
jgi:pimeloyl-ACP methyl ester carboxylesterase